MAFGILRRAHLTAFREAFHHALGGVRHVEILGGDPALQAGELGVAKNGPPGRGGRGLAGLARRGLYPGPARRRRGAARSARASSGPPRCRRQAASRAAAPDGPHRSGRPPRPGAHQALLRIGHWAARWSRIWAGLPPQRRCAIGVDRRLDRHAVAQAFEERLVRRGRRSSPECAARSWCSSPSRCPAGSAKGDAARRCQAVHHAGEDVAGQRVDHDARPLAADNMGELGLPRNSQRHRRARPAPPRAARCQGRHSCRRGR